MSTTDVTSTSNALTVETAEVSKSEGSKIKEKIKDKLNSVKTYILSHKSKVAQIAGAAGITAGIFVLAATGATPLGVPLIAIGSVAFLAGTVGLIIKKSKEGKANNQGSNVIASNILKETIKNTFIGVAIGAVVGICGCGSAGLALLPILKEKGEKALSTAKSVKNTGEKAVEFAKKGDKKVDETLDKFFKVSPGNKDEKTSQTEKAVDKNKDIENTNQQTPESEKPDTPKNNQNIEKKD